MFPIRDHNPSGRTPIVNYLLIATNVAVFLFTLALAPDPQAIERFFSIYAMIPARITEGEGAYTFFTSMFLHGGFGHILGNMLFLYIFGDNVEDELGHLGYLLFYILGGLAAGYIHYLSDPYSTIPTVGASGAISAVLGAYILLFPKARVDVLLIIFFFIQVVAVPAWYMLGLWFLIQLLSSLTVDTSMGGVAYWAHAGGFVAGMVMILPFWIRRGARRWWRETHGMPPHPEAHYTIRHTEVPLVPRRRRR